MSTNLSILPDNNTEYGTKEYWQKRYQEEPDTTFDWFKTYKELSPLLRKEIPNKDSSILMLGCGNSTLSKDMYIDGYENITNIDYSDIVIEQMIEQHKEEQHKMEWKTMDVRDLEFSDQSFDVALDKGTMDALMCEKGDVWEPSAELCENVAREVDEVNRVLKVGGKFIWITFGQPHFRKRHLIRDNWELKVEKINDGGFDYFVYILTKAV